MFKLQHLISLGVLCAVSAFCQPAAFENVIIKANKPYDKVIAAIEARGGKVTHRFKHTGAIAARVPQSAVADIRASKAVLSMRKDSMVQMGSVRNALAGERLSGVALPQAADGGLKELSESDIRTISGGVGPATYNIETNLMGLDALFKGGQQGKGAVVAIIDGGVRPGYPIGSSVIGGESLVGDGLGYQNDQDDGHATFVAGMIASHIGFLFQNTSPFIQALNAYAPGAAKPYDDTHSLVPMVGTAPGASLYILRVFPVSGLAPNSVIMAAMERVIELRELYDAGLPGGLNITVCNMSLGGLTVEPGTDPQDELVDAMLEHDIVPVVAAANAGPAPMTVSTPGTSKSALTVGGASLAHNERVVTDLTLGSGQGALYRPSPAHLMYFASGRGPDANGVVHPHVVASAHYNSGMGYDGPTVVSFRSGTSFATPCVAGIAAVLRQAYPAATARQIRNAIIASANPSILTAADVLDQGHGFVDAEAASNLLAAGLAPDTVDPLPDFDSSVQVNIERNTSLRVADGYVRQHVSVKPGERREILYRVDPNTIQVIVSLTGFSALPVEQQNQLQADNFSFGIHSALTSAGGDGEYVSELHIFQNGTKVINNPSTGVIRIVLNGNAHNVGDVSADVTIVSVTGAPAQVTNWGQIGNGKSMMIPFSVPSGTRTASFRLVWNDDWGKVPSADLDLLLLSPSAKLDLSGSTSNNPELFSIENPEPGNWTAIIAGFNIPAGTDTYELKIELDGKVIR